MEGLRTSRNLSETTASLESGMNHGGWETREWRWRWGEREKTKKKTRSEEDNWCHNLLASARFHSVTHQTLTWTHTPAPAPFYWLNFSFILHSFYLLGERRCLSALYFCSLSAILIVFPCELLEWQFSWCGTHKMLWDGKEEENLICCYLCCLICAFQSPPHSVCQPIYLLCTAT